MGDRLRHLHRLLWFAFALVIGLNLGPAGLALSAQLGGTGCERECLCDALVDTSAHEDVAEATEPCAGDGCDEHDACAERDPCPDTCPDCDCESGVVVGILSARVTLARSRFESPRVVTSEGGWPEGAPSRIFIPPRSAA